jgi:transposase-like protein
MKKQRKHYTPEEKVAILRRHLVEGVPISDLCDERGLQPTVFYRWQKEFFENGAAAFQQRGRTNHQPEQERIAYLEQKIQTKDEVSHGARSEVGGGAGTAEESPPAGRVTNETDYFRVADNSERKDADEFLLWKRCAGSEGPSFSTETGPVV